MTERARGQLVRKSIAGVAMAGSIAFFLWAIEENDDRKITAAESAGSQSPLGGQESASAPRGTEPITKPPFDGRTLAVRYSALRERAESGTAADALMLYTLLQHCHVVLTSTSTPDEIEALAAAGVNVKAMHLKLAEDVESCSKVPAGDLTDRGRWLIAAAEAGIVEAQLLYASDIESVLGVRKLESVDPLTAEHYRRRSLNFLETLAHRGNVDALQMLASAHDRGGLAGENRVASLGLWMVAHRLNPSPASSQVIDHLSTRLSIGERRDAELYAARLLAICCKDQ